MNGENLNDLQRVQLEILTELDRVCEENGLTYYLAFGTCLGALRHKGFIPWDDDIDVLMSYEDTRKLIQLNDQFQSRYFVQSRETDSEYQSIALRVRDSETTLIEKEEEGLDINHGIYVDVYPFYTAPKHKMALLVNIWKSYLYRILVANRVPYNHGNLMKAATKMVLDTYGKKNREKKIRKLEKDLSSVKDGDEILDYYGQDISYFSAITYPKVWFGKPKKLEFEGKLFNGATEPELYMEKRYGDYMKLPPVEDQVHHHTYVYMNANLPYKEYLKDKEN